MPVSYTHLDVYKRQSNMNMGGMGTRLMKKVMRDKNVSSLEELMKQAMAQGVRLVACTMSMDVMGITREELIDGVELSLIHIYADSMESVNAESTNAESTNAACFPYGKML